MAWLRTWRAPRSRATFLVVLLTLMLALTAVLAYEAHQSAASHRKVAHNVLRDYVEFASWEFNLAAHNALADVFTKGLTASEHALQAAEGAFASRAGQSLDSCDRPLALRSAFRLDPATGRIDSLGRPLDAGVVRLLEDAHRRLQPAAPARPSPEPPCTLIVRRWPDDPAGASGVVGYTLGPSVRGAPREIYGFVIDRARIERLFDSLVRNRPLLPPTLLPEHGGNAALAIRVVDESGEPVYQSAPRHPASIESSAFVAHGTLEQGAGRLQYQVALRPSVAEQLVIGGLPRSRLGLLVGLLALTTGLTIVALVQLRREYELARLRSDFVSSVSHELRTPLAQIRMFSETLLLGRVRSDVEGRRSLEIIQQEARRLGHLVENVLHVSKSQHRVTTLAREPLPLEALPLAPLLREVVDAFVPLARARRAAIRLDARRDVVAPVDASALRQILLNLLDNAVKYGPPGQTVTVTLSLAESGTASAARITVDDEGPGVPAKEASRIWEPFARLRQASEAGVAGAGIGLAVVRELTLRHDGRVTVTPAPSGGARFIVDLPGASAVSDIEAVEARSVSA